MMGTTTDRQHEGANRQSSPEKSLVLESMHSEKNNDEEIRNNSQKEAEPQNFHLRASKIEQEAPLKSNRSNKSGKTPRNELQGAIGTPNTQNMNPTMASIQKDASRPNTNYQSIRAGDEDGEVNILQHHELQEGDKAN